MFRKIRASRVFLVFAICLIVALLWLSGAHWTLLGHIKGEASYKGQPTRVWSKRLQAITVSGYAGFDVQSAGSHVVREYSRPSNTVWDWLDYLEGKPTSYVDVPEAEVPFTDGDPRAVPVLIELLDNRDPDVRLLAARGLCRIGPEAKGAMPALQKTLDADIDRREFDVVLELENAIERIDPEAWSKIATEDFFNRIRQHSGLIR